MKEFLLKKKWIGLWAIILVAVLFASYWAGVVSNAYKEAEPVILSEAGYFLPVSVKNGQIVFPKNTIIERTYGMGKNPYKVVLNTEVDDLNVSDLTTGVYFTRNKIYSYDAAKGETKIQSMEKIPDVDISRQDMNDFVETIGKYLNLGLFLIIFAFLSVYMSLIALFGSIVMQWLFKKLYGADFALTLRVNILTSVALFLLSVFLDVYFGLIITFLIMIACNYLANIWLANNKAELS